jgi:salicylate hydroxylase
VSAVPPGVVEAGRECTAVTQDRHSAQVMFPDGTSAAADLVIGADGLRSVVRAAIGTGTIRYTGSTSWRTLVPATKAPNAALRTGFEAWGRRGVRFGMGHLGEQISCYATAPARAPT